MLDRIFAFDNVANFHKLMGMVVGCLLIAHILLIMLGSKSTGLLSAGTSWRVDLGKAAISLALLTVVLALTFEVFGLDYNIWRAGHKSAAGIVALGFIHSYYIGGDLQSTGMRVFWWVLLVLFAGAWCYRNLFIPFFGRKNYAISSVERQVHNVYTVTLGVVKESIKRHKPGQFMFLKLKRPGRKSEIHPFTISCPPTFEDGLQATIKQSGNFTDTIDQTKTSDTAFVEGPYGQFSFLNYPEGPILFIAGGVGVTPVMSMLRYLRDTNDSRDVVLLYGNRKKRDIIFEDELSSLPESCRVVHILSEADEEWEGLRGYVTKDVISEQAGEMLGKAEIFLCGPPVMMDKVIESLHELGVSDDRVHYERFTI
jgi:predicted ferric reductase